jgi:N-acetylmuramoyl-L-alanine amidase
MPSFCERKTTTAVVFHHSASPDVSVAEIDVWHRKRGFQCIGYHDVIRRDGTIEHGRPVHSFGAHAIGRNDYAIGVCLCGDFRNYPPNEEQIESAVSLYHGYCRHYGKTLSIEFHHEECPGPKLNRKKFLERVSAGNPFA